MSRKDQLLSLLADSPDDAFLQFALAKELEKAADDAGAREVYEAIVRDHPKEPGTYYHLGKCLERLGNPLAADSAYAAGITMTKQLGENHAMRELLGARMELGVEEE